MCPSRPRIFYLAIADICRVLLPALADGACRNDCARDVYRALLSLRVPVHAVKATVYWNWKDPSIIWKVPSDWRGGGAS